jgi:hypothetical protein
MKTVTSSCALCVFAVSIYHSWRMVHNYSLPPQGFTSAVVAAIKEQELPDQVAQGSITGGLIVEANTTTTTTNILREYIGGRLFTSGWNDRIRPASSSLDYDDPPKKTCQKWGVVTTISAPTLAIQRAADLPGDWCLVIVADIKTPKDYLEQAGLDDRETVHFFSVDKQEEWARQSNYVAKLVQAIPYHHFGRKNLGYLYAIRNGAETIFDFDEDNIVNAATTMSGDDPDANADANAHGKPGSILLHDEEDDMIQNVSIPLLGRNIFNPYPLLQASLPNLWPRGFPLEFSQDSTTQGMVMYTKNISMDHIGVIQFCADDNPDMDAARDPLVNPSPITFAPESMSQPLLVPLHAFVPYNAQATLHMQAALWATFLPVTVPGRVSDIWRSYFGECLFRDLGLSVVFAPPRIVKVRNTAHDSLADTKAELDLHLKAGKLVEFLDAWTYSKQQQEGDDDDDDVGNTIPSRMEQLWIDLYERGYIEQDDVQGVQLWLAALVESNYSFPTVGIRERNREVVVMGQFNNALPIDKLLVWSQKWRELFQHVTIRGDFDSVQVAEMTAHGLDAHGQAPESMSGFFSPMRNLRDALLQFQTQDQIKAVMYTHDDAFVNLNGLKAGGSRVPTDQMIGNDMGKGIGADLSYADPRNVTNQALAEKFVYKIHPNASFPFQNFKGERFAKMRDLGATLKAWGMYYRPQCLPALIRVVEDKRCDLHRDADGGIWFSGYTQSDFLMVPTSVAETFVNVTNIFLDAGVYLECAMGPIVDFVRMRTNVTARVLPLCTAWARSRGKKAMVEKNCRTKLNGLTHPVKMGYGLKEWDESFDIAVYA